MQGAERGFTFLLASMLFSILQNSSVRLASSRRGFVLLPCLSTRAGIVTWPSRFWINGGHTSLPGESYARSHGFSDESADQLAIENYPSLLIISHLVSRACEKYVDASGSKVYRTIKELLLLFMSRLSEEKFASVDPVGITRETTVRAIPETLFQHRLAQLQQAFQRRSNIEYIHQAWSCQMRSSRHHLTQFTILSVSLPRWCSLASAEPHSPEMK